MTMTISGSGTITGISQGGLNDNIITQSELANTGVAGNGPAFSAYQSSAQTLASGTFTKIQCQTEEYDTNSNYDTTTYRFTPNVAGYYLVTSNIQISTTNTSIIVQIYKNGASVKSGQVSSTSGASGTTAFIYLNGSTDYIEMYGYFTVGQNTAAGQSVTWFQAALVRAA